jgi:hypothetical protein
MTGREAAGPIRELEAYSDLDNQLADEIGEHEGTRLAWNIEKRDTSTFQLVGLQDPRGVVFWQPARRDVIRVPVTDDLELDGLGRQELRSFEDEDTDRVREWASGLGESYFWWLNPALIVSYKS